MKKIMILMILLALTLFVACSKEEEIVKDGIRPYELSKEEKDILSKFAIERNGHLLEFKTSDSILSMLISVHVLEEDFTWHIENAGGVSIHEAEKNLEDFSGTLTMLLNEDHHINMVFDMKSRISFTIKEVISPRDYNISSVIFLNEFKDINLNEAIPIALMVYDDGNSMRTFTVDDFFEPTKFKGMDHVQVVSVTFYDQPLK